MKRYIIRILVCLFFGVITTVAVTWFLTIYVDPEAAYPSVGETQRDAGFLSVNKFISTGSERVFMYYMPSFQLQRKPLDPRAETLLPGWVQAPATDEKQEVNTVYDSRGWPMYSLSCRYDITKPQYRVETSLSLGGIPLDKYMKSSSTVPVALPCFPIWPGFAINSILFAGMWFLLFTLCSSNIIMRRKQFGRCPKCAYDIKSGDSAGCPECGWGRPDAQDS